MQCLTRRFRQRCLFCSMLEKTKEWAGRLKAAVPALYLALRRGDTPFFPKLLAALAVGYALSPVDLIPDFIPVLGYLDDLLLLPLLVALSVHFIPEEIWAECLEEGKGLWRDGKPKRWAFAVPVVILWLAAAGLIAAAVAK